MSKSRLMALKKVFPKGKVKHIKDTYLYEIEDICYAVTTEKESNDAVNELIEQTLYSADPEILDFFSSLSARTISFIQRHHDMVTANDEIWNSITDFDELVCQIKKMRSTGILLASDGKEIVSGRYRIYKVALNNCLPVVG